MTIHGVGMHGWVPVGAWDGEDLGAGMAGGEPVGAGIQAGPGVDGMIHFGDQDGAGDGTVGMAQAGVGTLVGAGMVAGTTTLHTITVEEVLLFGEAKAETATFLTDILTIIKLQLEETYPILELVIAKAQDLMVKEAILLLEITKVLVAKLFSQEETKLLVEVTLLKAPEVHNQA